MKNKKITNTIKRTYKAIRAFNNREKSSINDETNHFYEKLLKKHDQAIGLKDEIASLKTALKSKKKEIDKTVKELSENRKLAIKALKKSQKNYALDTALQTVKSRPSRTGEPSKDKSPETNRKPAKAPVNKSV